MGTAAEGPAAQYVVVTRYFRPGKAQPIVHTYGTYRTRQAANWAKGRLIRETKVPTGVDFEVWTCKVLG